MAFQPLSFAGRTNTQLVEADLTALDGNIDEVRASHIGPIEPPSLVAGIRHISNAGTVWQENVYASDTPGDFAPSQRIDPVSKISFPVELRRKNLIPNGSLDVWQDGTSETTSGNTNRVADGWRFQAFGVHGTWTISQSTDVPPISLAGRQLNFSMKVNCDVADTTVAAGDRAQLLASIEGFEYAELYQQPQTLSFMVKSSNTGVHCASVNNIGRDRSFIFEYSVNAANTWELKELVLREVPSGGTWNFQGSEGLRVIFSLAAGITYQAPAGSWQNGNFVATSNQQNLGAAVNNYLQIADVRLHGGTARSHILLPTFGESLKYAQRFFRKTFPYQVKPAQAAGYFSALGETATAGGLLLYHWRFEDMNAVPAITTYNPTQSASSWRNDADNSSVAASVTRIEKNGARITTTGATAETFWNIHATADVRYVG